LRPQREKEQAMLSRKARILQFLAILAVAILAATLAKG
jgi:hypothetical protein